MANMADKWRITTNKTQHTINIVHTVISCKYEED